MVLNRPHFYYVVAGFMVVLCQVSLSFANAKAKADLSEAVILKTYSLEQFDAAANVLAAAVDQNLNTSVNANPFCGFGKDEALVLSRPLKSLIDQKKTQRESELFATKQNANTRAQAVKTCASRCHCTVYASIFEARELNDDDKKTLERLNQVASQQPAKKALACAKSQGWFCQSRLLKFLRQEAPTYEAPKE